jgi:molecular chaperone DnaJ
MAVKRDYYEVLGISRSASEAEIKRAYRDLALKHHPDVHSGASDKVGAETRFKEINEAYSVLSDSGRRAQYDRFGHADFPGFSGASGAGDASPFGDLFEAFFGGGGPRGRTQPARGADLRYDLSVTLKDVLRGVEREISFDHLARCEVCAGTGSADKSAASTCPQCRGSGQVRAVRNTILGQMVTSTVCLRCGGRGSIITHPCKSCQGRGRKETRRKITVKVPAGVEEGTRLRFAGLGEAGERGASSGDLYVFIAMEPHETFERDGANLHCETDVSFTQAALGAKLEIEGLDGHAELDLPEGTQSGTRFRIPGRGLPRMRSNSRGDLLVDINVVVPERLTRKQRELLEAYARAGGEEVPEPGLFKKVKRALGNE